MGSLPTLPPPHPTPAHAGDGSGFKQEIELSPPPHCWAKALSVELLGDEGELTLLKVSLAQSLGRRQENAEFPALRCVCVGV